MQVVVRIVSIPSLLITVSGCLADREANKSPLSNSRFELVEVGPLPVPEADMVSTHQAVALSAEGDVAIALPESRYGYPQIVMVRRGKTAVRLAKRGHGPGEYEGLAQLAFRGSELLVAVPRSEMVLRYDSSGSYLGLMPFPRGGFLLGTHQDSADIMLPGFHSSASAFPRVIRAAWGEVTGRGLVMDDDEYLKRASGTTSGMGVIPIFAATEGLVALGDGYRYRIEVRTAEQSTPVVGSIDQELSPRRRSAKEKHADESDMEAAVRHPVFQKARASAITAFRRLRAVRDTQSLMHFTYRGLHFGIDNRLLVVGTTGDAAFVDIHSGAGWQAYERLEIPCFRPRTGIAVSDPWIALICEGDPESDEGPRIKLFRLEARASEASKATVRGSGS